MNMVKYMRVTRPESLLNFILENDANCFLHTVAACVNLRCGSGHCRAIPVDV